MRNLNSVYQPAYFNTNNLANPEDGEDNTAPTTKWLNPMWDQWFQQGADANGGKTPVFGRKGGLMGLPTSTDVSGLSQPLSLQMLDPQSAPMTDEQFQAATNAYRKAGGKTKYI